jgi:hypothetical protein
MQHGKVFNTWILDFFFFLDAVDEGVLHILIFKGSPKGCSKLFWKFLLLCPSALEGFKQDTLTKCGTCMVAHMHAHKPSEELPLVANHLDDMALGVHHHARGSRP